MAYESSADRMDRLETVLLDFIRHTDGARHAQDQAMTEFKQRVDQDIAEMRQWRIDSQKKWGEIANKLGSFAEDIVAPNIPRIGHQIFSIDGESKDLFSAARLRLQHPQDRSRMREFDYIYATNRGWIVVESNNDPKLKDV